MKENSNLVMLGGIMINMEGEDMFAPQTFYSVNGRGEERDFISKFDEEITEELEIKAPDVLAQVNLEA